MKLKTLVYDCSKNEAMEFISVTCSGKDIKIEKTVLVLILIGLVVIVTALRNSLLLG